MKERPILFSAPMVRAILAGSKTQTRRVVKGDITTLEGMDYLNGQPLEGCSATLFQCPYGQPGDRLWVRETWAARHEYDGHKPAHIPALARWHYAATEDRGGLLWRPSIHMPRWASRITLEITGVRVERLQAISEADAKAEGTLEWAKTACADGNPLGLEATDYFELLWRAINGHASWDANPWVWVVEFKRVTP